MSPHLVSVFFWFGMTAADVILSFWHQAGQDLVLLFQGKLFYLLILLSQFLHARELQMQR